MRPDAALPMPTVARFPALAKSTSPAPVAVPRGGADTSAPKPRCDGEVQTVALVEDRPIALRDLETFLALLTRVAGPRLIRLTGLVALADDPGRPLVLQPGRLAVYPLQRLATWPSQDRRTRMIAITRDLDPATLQRLFASVTSPWPDRMRIRIAMVASAALVLVFALGLALVLHAGAPASVQASSTLPRTQDRGF
jgi:hypothetical protein